MGKKVNTATARVNWSDWFYYDETSPSCLRWKVSKGNVVAGSPAGTMGGQFYYRVQLDGSVYTVHRIIWELHDFNIPEENEVDHIDQVYTNNKIGNLRCVTKSINCRNRGLRVDNKTGICGLNRRERVLKSGTLFSSWSARYVDISGKAVFKEFSIAKFGEDEAKALASKILEEMLAADQDGYTKQHGKVNNVNT